MQNILIIGFVWPEPNSSAAGSRMIGLIQLFTAQDWKVSFASAANDSQFMCDLDTLGVTKIPITLNCDSFDILIKQLNPTIVLFDRFMVEEQYGWRVSEQCPDTLKILDTVDLHCLRLARQQALKQNRALTDADLFSDTAKREIASILRCDVSLIIAQYELEILQTKFKLAKNLLYYLPILLPTITPKQESELITYNNRKDFVFIGNFVHPPNSDAVLYLKKTIWPLIRKQLPQAQLYIYGAYPTQKILELHKPIEGFNVMGRATDAKKIIQNALVLLAPLRFGAGIKGKLLEAMQHGTPSVTTSIGAESMAGSLPWNGFVADDPELFATLAVKLYQDKTYWYEVQKNGVEIINKRYAEHLFEKKIIEHLLDFQKNINLNREQNFIGKILQHHTLQSTKYLSKWIAQKTLSKLT